MEEDVVEANVASAALGSQTARAHRVDLRPSLHQAIDASRRLQALALIGQLRVHTTQHERRNGQRREYLVHVGGPQAVTLHERKAERERGRLDEERDRVGECVEERLHVQYAHRLGEAGVEDGRQLVHEVLLLAQARHRLHVVEHVGSDAARLVRQVRHTSSSATFATLHTRLHTRSARDHAREEDDRHEGGQGEAQLPVERQTQYKREADARNGLEYETKLVRRDALAQKNKIKNT